MITEKRKTVRQFNRDFAVKDWGKMPFKEERTDPFLVLAFAFEVVVITLVFVGFLS